MSNVIPFPSKKNFKAQFEGKIPDKILEEMLQAYDRVLLLKNEYPSGSFLAAPGHEQEAKRITNEFETFSLKLLQRILQLEAELCLIKQKPTIAGAG